MVEAEEHKSFDVKREEQRRITSQIRTYRLKKTNYFLQVHKSKEYIYFSLIFNINDKETILGYFVVHESNLSDIFVIKQSKGWQFLRKNIPEEELSTEDLEEILRDFIVFDLKRAPLSEAETEPMTQKDMKDLFKKEKEKLSKPILKTPIDFHPNIGISLLYPFTAPSTSALITKENVFPVIFRSEGICTIPAPNEFLIEIPDSDLKLNKVVLEDLVFLSETILSLSENKINLEHLETVLEKVLYRMCMYVWFRNDIDYLICACWAIGTFLHPMFDKFPYINILGVIGSGKTRLMKLLTSLSWNGQIMVDPSTAYLYRETERTKPTQGIDEDVINAAFKKKDYSLLAVAKAGFEKGIRVPRERKVEDTFVTEYFEVYSPKIWGGTEGIKDALLSRSIEFVMEKLPQKELVAKHDPAPDLEDCKEARKNIMLFAIQHALEVKAIFDALVCPDWMEGRDFDVWAPIQAICKVFFPTRYEELEKNIRKYVEDHSIIDYKNLIEKAILQRLLEGLQLDFYLAKDFLDPVTEALDYDKRPSWLNSNKIAMALKRLNIVKKYGTHKNRTSYIFDFERVRERAKQFGLELEPKKEPKKEPMTFQRCVECGAYVDNLITNAFEGERKEVCERCYRTLMKGEEYRKKQEGEKK